jgi:hypothetical protein
MAAPPLLGFRLLGMGPCEGQLLGRLGNSTGNVHQGKLIYDIYIYIYNYIMFLNTGEIFFKKILNTWKLY